MPGIEHEPWRWKRQILITRPNGNSWFCGNPVSLNEGWQSTYFYCKYDPRISQILSVGGESNPGLPRGRREFYHWTTNPIGFLFLLYNPSSLISVLNNVCGKTLHNFVYALSLKFDCELLGWIQHFKLDTDFKKQKQGLVFVQKWKSDVQKI